MSVTLGVTWLCGARLRLCRIGSLLRGGLLGEELATFLRLVCSSRQGPLKHT